VPLGLGQVHDADGALQARLAQRPHDRVVAAHRQQELLDAAVMEEPLVAPGQRIAHALALCRRIPVGGRGHRAAVGGHADQHALRAMALAHELADGPFVALPHFGRARVADVRVVLPDHDLRGPFRRQAARQRLQRFHHVRVAQVP
jgi:hypothetical protein